VHPEVKVCGLTRPEDAAAAAAAGAQYGGVIFAGGPRERPAAVAAAVLDAAPSLRRVGVVAAQPLDALVALARSARLDVLQLHAAVDADRVRAVRAATGCAVWAVVHVRPEGLEPGVEAVAAVADLVLLEPRVPGQLGGTGVTLPWALARDLVAPWRRPGALGLAGGLTPVNVREAVALLAPDLVDVSSGVESAPGIKDHAAMRAFVEAVAG
jgi:phosphoribosylanthranilate isomerase